MNKIIKGKEFIYGNCSDNGDTIILDILKPAELDISELEYETIVVNVKSDVFLLNLNGSAKKYIYNCDSYSILEVNNFNNNDNSFDIEVNLASDSKAKIVTSTISHGENKIKINVNHNGYNSDSLCINNGIVDTGSIFYDVCGVVTKGARESNVVQDSKIISYDVDKATIKPILVIDDTVSNASHAASIGSYSSDVLFYLESRGIKMSDGIKLLNRGLLSNNFKYPDEIIDLI